MKSRLSFVLILICSGLFASEVEVKEEVWIDGDSFYKSIRHKKRSTIYFSEWSGYVAQFLEDKNYYVALQLGKSFDPLPQDEQLLPSLSTLSAIDDEDVRKEYYGFLERFGRTFGISHMVLPDTSGCSRLEKDIIREVNAHSPYYFIHRSLLSHTIPDTKKEYDLGAGQKPTIWVASQDANMKRVAKWSSREGNAAKETFYEYLQESKKTAFLPTYELPHSLRKTIFTESVIARDPASVFPLRTTAISYLGMDLNLRNRLSQYVEVLNYRIPGIPCLIDLRSEGPTLELFKEDILLGIGAVDKENTALILPEVSIQNEDIIIAQMLFGSHKIVGRSSDPEVRRIPNARYLGFSDPQNEGLNPNHLRWVDSLANAAIKGYATPGLQVAVVRNGQLVMEKAYGFYMYDSLLPVSRNTIYDIASVTKVAATLPAITKLLDQGKIQLDDSIAQHLPLFKGSNKGRVTIKQLLSHNGGLRSYVPFWSMMMDGDRLDPFYYKTPEDEAQDIRTYGLEPHASMLDSLKSFIVKSELIKNPQDYNYSDLGFMILHLLVEEVSGVPFDQFLHDNFYEPMGLASTGFSPLSKGVSPKLIAPTEYDNRYRNYQVWGEVHDRNALVFGGVAGHAGLFSNARDLAKIMSMFINNGFYGGKQYLSKETLDQLNARHFENNRRGLGWDKKDGQIDAASSLASDQSFGHTGFTGTMVWADPKEDLIYVFLSNRIYPDASNWRLGELNTRTLVHDAIYQSLQNGN